MPKRIQRKRTAGWKMPLNTLNATRPSRHGNPYIMTDEYFRGDVLLRHRIYLDVMEREEPDKYDELLDEVRRADFMMCWCPLDKDCHADEWIRRIR